MTIFLLTLGDGTILEIEATQFSIREDKVLVFSKCLSTNYTGPYEIAAFTAWFSVTVKK
jgi:hypothetical protein